MTACRPRRTALQTEPSPLEEKLLMAEICSRHLDLQESASPPLVATVDSDQSSDLDAVPAYLCTHYWWAYIHPYGVWFFERQWLVNLILAGNYACLRDGALD